tara:strand:- start:3688 stop:4659 length:972 start_codon:yes stop_codon:yes gene_type:complete
MDNIKDVENLSFLRKEFNSEISKVIVGQNKIIDQIFIAILCNGHIILEGVPGLAKTLLINSVAKAFALNFNRIQFTPDLMPSDITGTEIIQENKSSGKREFKFYKGPIFSNIILADEINRTPPKTQSALLQAMQENNVTIGNETYKLNNPFFVFATQNPIEQEGTYPLPEAQLDRFMFNLLIDYPSIDEETLIVKKMNDITKTEIQPIISIEKLKTFQDIVINMPVSDNVVDYIVNLVRSTRITEHADVSIKKWLNWGAGPRASSVLLLASKANALINGRTTPEIEDVKFIAKPVLRHRIIPNFNAEAEGLKCDDIIDYLLEK